MSESLSDRYFALIDQIVELTLQGKISSFERVYKILLEKVDAGTGEILERCLNQRIEATKAQLDTKLKAARVLRALQTIEKQWLRWQSENQVSAEINETAQDILAADPDDYFLATVDAIDPNLDRALSIDQLHKLAASLKAAADGQENAEIAQSWQQLATGITSGLKSFTALEGDLVSWMYGSASSFAGFGSEKPNPWRIWAQKVPSPLPKQLFQTLAQQQSAIAFARVANNLELQAWVELAILLQYLQRGLVTWFDQQPYNSKFGKELSNSTFLTFASIWCELWQVFIDSKPALADGCFLAMLQILRTFAQRPDFPLYSGVFASFSGDYLQDTLDYFDEPLKQVEGTEEKARILTLLGYSQRTIGAYDKAVDFHQEALEIAIEADDYACEIANLNHLSRTSVNLKKYSEAINYSQRALIAARQVGDKLGEANASVNLGYAQVFAARQLDNMAPEGYSEAIRYLEQGVELAKKQGDLQSQSFGCSSLGIAYVILEQPTAAIASLTKGAELAQYSRDVYLQGLSFSYLAEAHYSIENIPTAIAFGSLGMYLLNQINSVEWRQVAGLISIIQGQLGESDFTAILGQQRAQIIGLIGVDGYDYLPKLLTEYKQN
ncbi:tetratricopeptide repeat protein [Pleurocapsa sp. FMAR1]|uniref:tetratricopeptide repeat protein n=1 Tax=Pleurocapsa sp. FMAR1 TaxID=3040204 RepID=UPI0029C89DB7|nr:tetratricopeptide repeat protein [Pleurocapsa sp. FMAR1]